MPEATLSLGLIVLYRITIVIVGSLFGLWGYRLFRHGLYEKAGDLKAAWGNKNLVLKQAAPGTFFALFGAAVISFGLWRGIEFDLKQTVAVPKIWGEIEKSASTETSMALSDKARSVLQKAADGKPLSDSDRQAAKDWLKSHSVHITAGDPPKKPDNIQ